MQVRAHIIPATCERPDKAGKTIARKQQKRKGNGVHERNVHDPEFLVSRGIDVGVISKGNPMRVEEISDANAMTAVVPKKTAVLLRPMSTTDTARAIAKKKKT